MTQAPSVTLQYDAENRQVAYGSTTYVYDGLGNRVEKIDQSNNVTTYVYDAFGNLAAEYGGSGSITPGTQYVTVDALGSTRLVMSGALASERHDFQPFGLEDFGDTGTWRAGVAGYNVDTFRQKFTGQERDSESYLDYFQARYFSGIQGRFTSPDPGNAGAGLGDPQSWNGYAYVSGNPLTFTDPSGGSGSNLSTPEGHLSNVAWTPTPSWSVTGWGVADTDGGVYTVPGLLFYAQATGAMPKAAKKAPTFEVRVLPNDALTCNAMGQQFYAPPRFSIKTIATAGKAGGMFNVPAMGNAVGHYGTFDFQRVRDSAGNTTFYSGYTPVSNVAVGAYMYGADYTKVGALAVAKTFKLFVAGNKGAASAPVFTSLGWDLAAGKGSASCSPIPH